MTHTAAMVSRMRAVLHHTFEAIVRADRGRRFLKRDERGRPHWPSLREFMLAALHESGGDEEAAGQFKLLPASEQDRLLSYYERSFQPCKGLALSSRARPHRDKGKSEQDAGSSAAARTPPAGLDEAGAVKKMEGRR